MTYDYIYDIDPTTGEPGKVPITFREMTKHNLIPLVREHKQAGQEVKLDTAYGANDRAGYFVHEERVNDGDLSNFVGVSPGQNGASDARR